jgi:hypothetical protein
VIIELRKNALKSFNALIAFEVLLKTLHIQRRLGLLSDLALP